MARVSLIPAAIVLWIATSSMLPAQEADGQGGDAGQDAAVPEGHSHFGEAFNEGPRQAAYLMGTTGKVHIPITTGDSRVQAFFDQGVGQLHGFWYFEAERSFRQAAAIDPACAMAYWGMAMANFEGNKSRAAKFIAEAQERQDAITDRERLWIKGLADYLASYEKDRKQAARNYIRDLESLIHGDPDDIEAKAFLVVRLWQFHGDVPINSRQAVDALIDQIFAAEPMHPAHHYRIHLWDREKPERALASAARCGQSAPGIAHMWHMSNHTFSGLKRYADAVWQQAASARVDHAHMIRDRVLPDQIHNYAHNQEWMIRNLNFIGGMRTSIAIARNLIDLPRHPKYNTLAMSGKSASYGRTRLLETLELYELWEDLIALSETPDLEPTDITDERIKRLRALGVARFGLGDRAALDAVIAELESRRDALTTERDEAVRVAEGKAREDGKSDKEVEEAGKSAGRETSGTIDRIKTALDELAVERSILAGDQEAARTGLKEIKGLSKSRRAWLSLQAGDAEAADTLSREAVGGGPGEVVPLATRAAILHQLGKTDAAVEAFEALRAISGHIEDLSVPPFRRLAPLAASLGLPEDWRVEATVAEDVGERPDLDTLGPLLWQPPAAPDWRLPDAQGRSVGLEDYRGRPVVVIFYLGFGCLHCVEQLTTFGPRVNDFEKAGIAMVAIGTDPVDKLKTAVDDYEEKIPFPLLSNAALDAFHAYRAFDDFENEPLHGTFLIDAEGLIRWQDISYEPFNDPDFVLDEARRLLEIPSGEDSEVTGG